MSIVLVIAILYNLHNIFSSNEDKIGISIVSLFRLLSWHIYSLVRDIITSLSVHLHSILFFYVTLG